MMMVTNEILHVMLECEKEFYDHQHSIARIVKSSKQQEKHLISPPSI